MGSDRNFSQFLKALLAEFDAEMASGKHDKELLKEWGNYVAENFLKARGLKPDYRAMCARTQAEIEVVMRGVPRDAAALAELTGQDEQAETGDAPPSSRPQPGDPDRAGEPPGEPSGAGPPEEAG